MKTCWKCNIVPIFQPEPEPTTLAFLIYFTTLAVSILVPAVVFLITKNVFLILVLWYITTVLIRFILPFIADDRPKTKRKLDQIANIVFTSSLVNFLLFMVFSFVIGGAAIPGKIEAGQYFLSFHSGVYTEVSYGVYLYSTIHSMLLGFHILLGIVSRLTFCRGAFR